MFRRANDRLKLRVLVVDQNRNACDALVVLLGLLGHEARAATRGADVLMEASSGMWDLALVDLSLPDMDGCDVARALRRTHGQRIKLAAVTGYQGEKVTTNALAAGFDHVFVKPLAIDVLDALMKMIAFEGQPVLAEDQVISFSGVGAM